MKKEEFTYRVEAIRGQLYKTAMLYLGSHAQAVDALDERERKSAHAHADHDAREHQASRNRIDIRLNALHAVHDDRRNAALDIALRRQEQEDASVHHVHADDLLEQVLMQQHRREANAEEDHGRRLIIIGKQHIHVDYSSPFLKTA